MIRFTAKIPLTVGLCGAQSAPHNPIDYDLRIIERVKGKALPSEIAYDALHAEFGVKNPLPHQSGYDERECEWIKQNCAERVFETDFLIEQGCKYKANNQRKNQREKSVYQDIFNRDVPAIC